jgi:hypothetical protein
VLITGLDEALFQGILYIALDFRLYLTASELSGNFVEEATAKFVPGRILLFGHLKSESLFTLDN